MWIIWQHGEAVKLIVFFKGRQQSRHIIAVRQRRCRQQQRPGYTLLRRHKPGHKGLTGVTVTIRRSSPAAAHGAAVYKAGPLGGSSPTRWHRPVGYGVACPGCIPASINTSCAR
jgi:hypothetical protein